MQYTSAPQKRTSPQTQLYDRLYRLLIEGEPGCWVSESLDKFNGRSKSAKQTMLHQGMAYRQLPVETTTDDTTMFVRVRG